MLFDKFQAMADFQAELAARNVEPFGAVTEKIISATEGVVQGRNVILAGTNNYLGLSFDTRCIKAAQEAAAQKSMAARHTIEAADTLDFETWRQAYLDPARLVV